MLATARDLWGRRELIATLVGRELKARYRGSLLGFAWSLVNPALLLAVYVLVFGLVFKPQYGGAAKEPYALFLAAGVFSWLWLAGGVTEGSGSIVANAGLVRKATFPAAVLPIVATFAHLTHFLFALPILGIAALLAWWAGEPVGGLSALLLPLVIALQIPFVGGLALGFAALATHFRDVKDLLANALTLLFFLTPVLYPLAAIPWKPLWWLVRLNPATPFTLAYQQTLFFGVVPDLTLWFQMAVVALVAWSGGTWLFRRLSGTLIEAV